MPRRLPRRVISYPLQNDEEYAQEQPDKLKNNRLISDITQGFAEAQVNLSQNKDGNNQEILGLLEKVSKQLERLQQPSGGNLQKSGNRSQYQLNNNNMAEKKDQSTQSNAGNQSAIISQELQNLFNKIVQGNGSADNATLNDGSENNTQEKQTNNTQKADKNNTVAVQTAAQVLAQAQYELANELEASLKKLKQVISESEKVANKISNLLGETNNNKKS